jgi:hypothetical protein
MSFVLQPWPLLLLTPAGWLNREQQHVIEYLMYSESGRRRPSSSTHGVGPIPMIAWRHQEKTMCLYSRDTSPDTKAFQIEGYRCMSPAQKLALAGAMYETVRTLAEAGIRARFPQADEGEIRRRLADALLGPALARDVYGPGF